GLVGVKQQRSVELAANRGLLLSRAARPRGRRQGSDRRLLRRCGELLLLERLLDRRASRPRGGATLSDRLQRHPVRRTGYQLAEVHPGGALARVRHAPRRRRPASMQAHGVPDGGDQRVRQGRRRRRRRGDRRPVELQVDPATLVGTNTQCGPITAQDAAIVARIVAGPRTTDGTFLWYGL